MSRNVLPLYGSCQTTKNGCEGDKAGGTKSGLAKLGKRLQRSELDLLPNSEIYDDVAAYCDAEGITFLAEV